MHSFQQAMEIKRREAKTAVVDSDRFKKFCTLASVPPTRRQAAKFIARRGAAWRASRGLYAFS